MRTWPILCEKILPSFFLMENNGQQYPPLAFKGIITYLGRMKDFRVDRTKRHELLDVLVIAVCAGIAGVKTWTGVEEFGKAKFEFFKTFLNLKHGIPSHDTFRRIFMLMDEGEFIKIFTEWIKEVTKGIDLKQICIDGKTLRRSFSEAKKSSAFHLVNAWSTGTSLCLAQLESEGKKNEIKTIPKVLDLINVKGSVVSIDAMGCQKEIAQKIISQEGTYLLQVKGNHKYLEQRIKSTFDNLPSNPRDTKDFTVETFKTEGKGHGRFEKRQCTVISEKEGRNLGVDFLKEWPSLKTLIQVCSERTDKATGKTEEQARYFISNGNFTGEGALSCVRGHWEVENKLHWRLDMAFREDESRHRAGESAKNCALLRKMVLNLLNMGSSDKTLPLLQQRAATDNAFLMKVLLRDSVAKRE